MKNKLFPRYTSSLWSRRPFIYRNMGTDVPTQNPTHCKKPTPPPFRLHHNTHQKEILLIYINKESSFLQTIQYPLHLAFKKCHQSAMFWRSSTAPGVSGTTTIVSSPSPWPAGITTNCCHSGRNSGTRRTECEWQRRRFGLRRVPSPRKPDRAFSWSESCGKRQFQPRRDRRRLCVSLQTCAL